METVSDTSVADRGVVVRATASSQRREGREE
jgi:hypothetical protein